MRSRAAARRERSSSLGEDVTQSQEGGPMRSRAAARRERSSSLGEDVTQ